MLAVRSILTRPPWLLAVLIFASCSKIVLVIGSSTTSLSSLQVSAPTLTLTFGSPVTLQVIGGVAPYGFSVTSGSATVSPLGVVTALQAGDIELLVEDARGSNATITLTFRLNLTSDIYTLNAVTSVNDLLDKHEISYTPNRSTSTQLVDGRILVAGGGGAGTSTEIFDPAANSGVGGWSPGPTMNTARSSHSASLLQDGRVLVAGGSGAGTTVEIFDPAANGGLGAWSNAPALVNARSDHSGITLSDGRVLIVGGFGLNETEIFDPTANGGIGQWNPGPDLTFFRMHHSAHLMADGRVIVIGGYGQPSFDELSTVEIFDPAANGGLGAWTLAPSLSTGRRYHSSVVLNDNRIAVLGGETIAPQASLSSVEIFDPAANGGLGAWSAGTSLSAARSRAAVAKLSSGRLLFSGGKNLPSSNDDLDSSFIFDPAANAGLGSWTSTAAMGFSMSDHRLITLASGNVLSIDTNSELFNPLGNAGVGAWIKTAALIVARVSHTATRLQDNRVLVAGGTNGAYTNRVEIFDPRGGDATGWIEAPSMLAARADHAAVRLNDGRIMVMGGRNTTGYLNSVEFFNPIANGGLGAWAAGPSFVGTRYRTAALVLNDGKVLLVGGFNGSYLNTAQIFDPLANGGLGSWTALPNLPSATSGSSAVVMQDGRVLFAAVDNGSATTNAYIFDPALNAGVGDWIVAPSLSVARAKAPVTLLPSGEVMIFGGYSFPGIGGITATTEIFDPLANGGLGDWSMGPSMAEARWWNTSLLGGDGKIYVVGGMGNSGAEPIICEVFDPLANGGLGAWSLGPSFGTKWFGQSATLLGDGRLLYIYQKSASIISLFESATLSVAGNVGDTTFNLLNGTGSLLYEAGDTTATFIPNALGTFDFDAVDSSANSSPEISIVSQ